MTHFLSRNLRNSNYLLNLSSVFKEFRISYSKKDDRPCQCDVPNVLKKVEKIEGVENETQSTHTVSDKLKSSETQKQAQTPLGTSVCVESQVSSGTHAPSEMQSSSEMEPSSAETPFSSSSQSISSLIRHNFHEECEAAINQQINCELYASYTYFCMATCMSRPETALFGYAKFFAEASQEELVHAQRLANFVNMRGGHVMLCDVLKPIPTEYRSAEDALEDSLTLEKTILKNIEELHAKATSHNDVFLADFLESHYITEQYQGIQQLGEMLTRLRRAGPGVGVTLLDIDLLRHPPTSHGSGNKE